MSLTNLEARFYESVPARLRDISESLQVLTESLNTRQEQTPLKEALKPRWDEEHKAVHIPLIDKFLDARHLTEDIVTKEEALELAKEAGKELPDKKDTLAILFFKEEINAIIEKHSGDTLDCWEWTSIREPNSFNSFANYITDKFGVITDESLCYARAITKE